MYIHPMIYHVFPWIYHGISKDIPCIYHVYVEVYIYVVYTRHIPGIYLKSGFQMYDIKQHPLHYFCKHSHGTYKSRYVQNTYLEQIVVSTRYVLVVKRTYLHVPVHTHTHSTHTSFSIRNHHCDPHESPSDACLTLCGQHPSYLKSPQLSDCLFHGGCIQSVKKRLLDIWQQHVCITQHSLLEIM